MIIPPRYNGPPDSANGGYTCGLVAHALRGDVEVTLRRPPPLGVELDLVDGRLLHGDDVVAEARAARVGSQLPEPVSVAEAEAASRRYAGFRAHAYPTCFTCGPARDDGLRVFAGRVAGRDGLVASPWTPEAARPEIVWAALDCPSGWAVDDFQREGVLLGRMAAHLEGPVAVGEPHVVVGWRIGEEGRKRYAGSALYSASGEPLAWARSTWIVPRAAEGLTGTGRAPAT